MIDITAFAGERCRYLAAKPARENLLIGGGTTEIQMPSLSMEIVEPWDIIKE
jgi:hypothetical protein